MKKLISVLSALMLAGMVMAQSDLANKTAGLLKSANSAELSKLFSSSITLSIMDEEDVYSRAQAELIMKKFFTQNKPSGFKSIHNGTSKTGMEYIIGNLSTSSGEFRITYFIAKSGEKMSLKELRIEESDSE